jgi:hypothetical protein
LKVVNEGGRLGMTRPQKKSKPSIVDPTTIQAAEPLHFAVVCGAGGRGLAAL